MINNISIRTKLAMVLLIPMILLVYLSVTYLQTKQQQLVQAERHIASFQLIQELDRTIHHIAYERGISAGFLGLRSTENREKLSIQRSVVDQQFQQLDQVAQEQNLLFGKESVALEQLFPQLQAVREMVEQPEGGQAILTTSFKLYSAINEKLLLLIQDIVSKVGQLSLARQSRALYALLSIKERAGQERGRLNNFFSTGQLSVNAGIEINHYIHDQKIKENEFVHHATDRQIESYQQKISQANAEQLNFYRVQFFSRLKKEQMLEELKGLIGFGGLIHSFKNYVIRGEEQFRQRFEQGYTKASQLIMRYKVVEGITVSEFQLLDMVQQNIDAYHANLEIISRFPVEDRNVVAIDAKVKVDDADALDALARLSKFLNADAATWFSIATRRIENIDRMASEIDVDLLAQAKDELKSVQKDFLLYAATISLLVVTTILLAFYVWRALSRSIGHTLEVIDHAEKSGDISARITVYNRDEMGNIGIALNRMFGMYQTVIQESIAVLQSVEEERFGHQIKTECAGDLEQLKSGVNKAAIRVEKNVRAKDDFFASMSHELRTPLTSIIGNSGLLLEGGHCGGGHCFQKDAVQIINSIHSAGNNQLALVDDILDMSKIESGKFAIEEAPYDLAVLLSELKKMFSVRAADAGIRFVVDQKYHEHHLLTGDAQRISQVLINLISNAIKFTEQGEVRLTVWLDAEQIIFQVKDSGIGMSVEEMDKLFQRFHQADSSISRRFGGSGLGLYISENLADLMGGRIDVSSQVGEGSIFQLVLPYKPTDTTARIKEESKANASILSQQLVGHILVVEDTLEMQLLEQRMLESLGLTVSVAENGAVAVEKVALHPYDLVLMDMQMPVMDGIEATRILRQQGCTLPIIALTANVMQKHRDAFFEAGCDGFIGKPIDRKELMIQLKQHLSLRQDRNALEQMGIEDRRKEDRRSEEIAVIMEDRDQPAPRRISDRIDRDIQNMGQTVVLGEVDDDLIAIFKQSTARYRERLDEALSQQDWALVKETAHSIKGASTSFGFPELTAKATTVCEAYDNHQFDQVPQLTELLIRSLVNVVGGREL